MFDSSFPVGARNNASSAEDTVPAGGHTDRSARRPGHHGEARQDQAEARLAGAGREAGQRAQGCQVRGVLGSHTGLHL